MKKVIKLTPADEGSPTHLIVNSIVSFENKSYGSRVMITLTTNGKPFHFYYKESAEKIEAIINSKE